MRTLAIFLCLMFTLTAWAEGSDPGDGLPSEVPAAASPSPPHFLSDLIPDQEVSLGGKWNDRQRANLREGVTFASWERPSRAADISEWTFLRSIKFTHGPKFAHREETYLDSNPAAIFGSGISGVVTTIITIPARASSTQISEYLKTSLPPLLIEDESELNLWRRWVGRAKRGTFCESLLAMFR